FRQGKDVVLFEQGFLASSHSWSEAFRQKNPILGCLGYVYDDISHYFMADYPNRLIHRLNSARELTKDERSRAHNLVERIVERKISKYNSQPIHRPAMTEGYSRRVLVCDQTFADASTVYGKVGEAEFEQMLLAAIRENPDAEIIVKTHPDTFWEKDKRTGYYNHLQDTGRVRILRDPINPYCLFDLVDKVYVGTSQVGLEALFAGKEVVCFGAPFYAGWGLTDDRQPVPHRHRTRSLEEIFHYFYIWYTIYHVPGCVVPSQIEDVMDYIEENRPVQLPPTVAEQAAPPKVSVILPVYGVEKYIEQCLVSIQRQTLREIEIIPVNDKSPDGSQAIIDRLAAEDPRIRPIVLPENVGQGFARNEGIRAARGEYILFIDSDDYMPSPDHLRLACDCASRDRADMVRGRKIFEQVEDRGGNIKAMRKDGTEVRFDTPFHAVKISEEPKILHSRHFWNWLYRRAFLEENGIIFMNSQWVARPFLLKALLSADRLSGIDSQGVIYRIREDSTARREKTLKDAENQLMNFEQVIGILDEHGAFANGSSLRYVAAFQVSQFLHFLFRGFTYSTVKSNGPTDLLSSFLLRIRDMLERTGMTAEDLISGPTQLSNKHVSTNAYALLFEAVRSGRDEFIDVALSLKPIDQAALFKELLTEPADEKAAAFQTALSLYARNDLVKTDKDKDYDGPKPRIVVHIGTTKTGSTFIQHFLEKNRAALLREGVWFPEVGLFWQEDRPHKQAGHSHFTPEAVAGQRKLKNHIEAGLRLAQGKIHTIILSSEAYFLNRNSVEISHHFAGYPVEMIGYFRRQDDWANSQYAEFVAGGAIGRVSVPIAEWLRTDETRLRLDYFSYLELWAGAIGRENVQARIYDRKAFDDGDVVTDFMTQIGLSHLSALPRPTVVQSNDFPFNSAHVQLIRNFNAMEWPDKGTYLRFIDDVTRRISEYNRRTGAATPRVNMLTMREREEIMEMAEASNRELARIYFGREDGNLFDGPVAFPEEKEQGISQEEINIIFGCYERHKPEVARTGEVTWGAATNTVETLGYKAFSRIAGPFLTPAKKRKLALKPDRFFTDSKSRAVRLVWWCVRKEKGRQAKTQVPLTSEAI
ncbi:MAG: capsular polysaccharide export protein, LipB/KpsS family, partial [Planctomycetota bacterium]